MDSNCLTIILPWMSYNSIKLIGSLALMVRKSETGFGIIATDWPTSNTVVFKTWNTEVVVLV